MELVLMKQPVYLKKSATKLTYESKTQEETEAAFASE